MRHGRQYQNKERPPQAAPQCKTDNKNCAQTSVRERSLTCALGAPVDVLRCLHAFEFVRQRQRLARRVVRVADAVVDRRKLVDGEVGELVERHAVRLARVGVVRLHKIQVVAEDLQRSASVSAIFASAPAPAHLKARLELVVLVRLLVRLHEFHKRIFVAIGRSRQRQREHKYNSDKHLSTFFEVIGPPRTNQFRLPDFFKKKEKKKKKKKEKMFFVVFFAICISFKFGLVRRVGRKQRRASASQAEQR